jgi:hypothetical protein
MYTYGRKKIKIVKLDDAFSYFKIQNISGSMVLLGVVKAAVGLLWEFDQGW